MYVKINSLVFCHVFRCYLWNDPHVPSVKVDLIIILIVICCQQLWMSSQWKVQFLSVWRHLPEPTTFLSGRHRLILRTGSTENIENIGPVSLMWMWLKLLNIGVFAKSNLMSSIFTRIQPCRHLWNLSIEPAGSVWLFNWKSGFKLGSVWTHLVRFPDPLALPKASDQHPPTCKLLSSEAHPTCQPPGSAGSPLNRPLIKSSMWSLWFLNCTQSAPLDATSLHNMCKIWKFTVYSFTMFITPNSDSLRLYKIFCKSI